MIRENQGLLVRLVKHVFIISSQPLNNIIISYLPIVIEQYLIGAIKLAIHVFKLCRCDRESSKKSKR